MSHYSQAICALGSAPRSRAEVASLAALLLPGFGAVVFAVTLLQVLFLSQGAQALFRDSNTGWHVRNGEAILNTAAAPRVDRFSFTRDGRQWFAWEWLSDALLGGAHRIAGLSGVGLLAALAIALTAWGAARLSLSLGGNLFFTAAAMVLLLGTTSIHWLARPHVFSWLLALLFLSVAEHERRSPGRALYGLPLLACLWANLHGSFLLGPAILFLYAMGEWLEGRRRRNAGPRFAAACLASLLATWINPYGWRLHEHVVTYLQNDYLMDHISEFRSFSFHSPGALYVELFLLVAVLGAVALLRQRAFGPVLLALAMLHLSLYSARHLPTAAVLLLPLCVGALTREAEDWPRLRPLLDYSERLRAIDRKIWGVVPILLVLAGTLAGLGTLARAGSVGFNSAKFPVRAADFLEQHDAQHDPRGRVFAKDQWGGYLIYRFAGRTKVFVDGRGDFYGQDFLETYARVAEVKPGWDAVLKRYDVQFVLVPPDHALASALQLSSDWKRVYLDSVAAVFERVG
ncbi:MAG: hypothetical protein HYX74_07740 [Acidobacteria bacterium]|nr:hypothetical protein [Acidobacteriota bacterium]